MKYTPFGIPFLSLIFVTYQLSSVVAVVRNVMSAEQFQHALDKAMPGDVIKLRFDEIFFEGQQFTASRSGEAGDPIVITGSTSYTGSISIKLDASSNSTGTTGLTILGDYWIIEGIELMISEPHTGVLIEGNNNSLSSLLVTAYDTGVYVNGSGNILVNSIIKSKNGTGIFVAGEFNNITSNVVEGTEWGMYFKDGSCCQQIDSNTIKGPVSVQGSNHLFRGDVINGDLLVSDCSNQFLDVTVKTQNPSNPFENCSTLDNEGVIFVH